MEIAISDTNIFIDLYNIGLLDLFCQLPCKIHTTDFIIHELNTTGVKEKVLSLVQAKNITVKRYKATEYGKIIALAKRNLSLPDCSIVYYALEGNYRILTGDRNLRLTAEENGLKVSGILFVLDLMAETKLLTIDEYKTKLKELYESNKRLPTSELKKRLG